VERPGNHWIARQRRLLTRPGALARSAGRQQQAQQSKGKDSGHEQGRGTIWLRLPPVRGLGHGKTPPGRNRPGGAPHADRSQRAGSHVVGMAASL